MDAKEKELKSHLSLFKAGIFGFIGIGGLCEFEMIVEKLGKW